jgi:hypothetical protein
MKVGILTIFSIPNYGAMLQSHGLSSYLRSEGVDAEVINYRQPALDAYFRFKWSFPPAVNHWRRLRNCDRFAKNSIRTGSGPVTGPADLQAHVSQYDAFITGSDQVWFTGPVQYYDPMFFLDFPAPGKRKISYAASAGGNESFGEFEETVRAAIDGMDHVGVRDAHTESLVRPLTDKPITRNVDPVLLYGFDELLSDRSPVSEPYILVFGDFRGKLAQVIRDVRRATGIKKVITLQYPCPEADQRLPSPGPEAWLNWFRHAAFVVTSYFHGTVVSVKFNRPFVSVPTPGRRHKVATFLEPISLRQRCFNDENELRNLPAVACEAISWQPVNADLDVLVTTSKSFLRDSLA